MDWCALAMANVDILYIFVVSKELRQASSPPPAMPILQYLCSRTMESRWRSIIGESHLSRAGGTSESILQFRKVHIVISGTFSILAAVAYSHFSPKGGTSEFYTSDPNLACLHPSQHMHHRIRLFLLTAA